MCFDNVAIAEAHFWILPNSAIFKSPANKGESHYFIAQIASGQIRRLFLLRRSNKIIFNPSPKSWAVHHFMPREMQIIMPNAFPILCNLVIIESEDPFITALLRLLQVKSEDPACSDEASKSSQTLARRSELSTLSLLREMRYEGLCSLSTSSQPKLKIDIWWTQLNKKYPKFTLLNRWPKPMIKRHAFLQLAVLDWKPSINEFISNFRTPS
jgi:hypothetical protein